MCPEGPQVELRSETSVSPCPRVPTGEQREGIQRDAQDIAAQVEMESKT